MGQTLNKYKKQDGNSALDKTFAQLFIDWRTLVTNCQNTTEVWTLSDSLAAVTVEEMLREGKRVCDGLKLSY